MHDRPGEWPFRLFLVPSLNDSSFPPSSQTACSRQRSQERKTAGGNGPAWREV